MANSHLISDSVVALARQALPQSFQDSPGTSSPNSTTSVNHFDTGDTTWIMVSAGLVWLMIPGVGYFYSGMAQRKNALSLIMLSMWSVAVVLLQWFAVGYSLTFSTTGNWFIGDFKKLWLQGIATQPAELNSRLPELTFCIYQGMFAAITPALAIGAAAERARVLPAILFILLWTTFVYDFIAYWTWNPRGWSSINGGLDFAGGTPVHIASGASALAYAILLGHRVDKSEAEVPHNMINVLLGTSLIWFGWFGFNGGSALASGTRATMAIVVTNIAACAGGITWTVLDYRVTKNFSAMGFCVGLISGLVCITPGSGFVDPPSAVAFGVIGAAACHSAMKLKHLLHFDDALDVFAVHGIGGIVGNLLTGALAQKSIAALDGTQIEGGWIDRNWMQMVHQLADTGAGLGWSFCITFLLLWIMNKIPGLSLRVPLAEEQNGLDVNHFGFNGYEYMERERAALELAKATEKVVDEKGVTTVLETDAVRIQVGPAVTV